MIRLNEVVQVIQRKWRQCRGRAFYRKCHYTSAEIFYGRKERRAESVFRPFKGDYINFKSPLNKMYLAIGKKFNETQIFFADKLKKVNTSFSSQVRTLVITNLALYNIGGLLRENIQRRIAIKSISGISLSTMQDSFLVIHVSGEYDYVYESPKKNEITTLLVELYLIITSQKLPVDFSDNINYTAKGGKKRQISFVKDESCIEAKFKKSGEGMTVSIATGFPKETGRKKERAVKNTTILTQINRNGVARKAPVAKFQTTAIHDYTAKNARELTFRAGDVINVLSKDITTGMWQGEVRGKRGIFPATHVETRV